MKSENIVNLNIIKQFSYAFGYRKDFENSDYKNFFIKVSKINQDFLN